MTRTTIIDKIAARLGVWALGHLFAGDCVTDVRDDFPTEPDVHCPSCDAKRLIGYMREL